MSVPVVLDIRPQIDVARSGKAALMISFLLVVVLGGWAALTPISSAVIGAGQVVVSGHPRQVQNFEGGVISAILVQNGDQVTEGEVLLELDATMLATNLDIAKTRLAAVLALQARLLAEQKSLAVLTFSYPKLPFALPDLTDAEAAQHAIFAARAAVRKGEAERTVEAVAQIDAQIAGTKGQITAITTRRDIAVADLAKVKTLAEGGLVRKSDLSAAESTLAGLEGEAARLSSEAAALVTTRRDAQLAGAQAERAMLEEIVTELRETTDMVEELTLEIITRSAALDRVEIRAPATGIVHDLQVTTVGGVLAPGATAMQIIPLADGMDFEVRVDPRGIDQVWPGQPAELTLSSFDPQTTPKLQAEVVAVPADAIRDPQTGASFYKVLLRLKPGEAARLTDQEIRPGMPVEAHLATGSHSVLAYLMDPISSHLARAFRE